MQTRTIRVLCADDSELIGEALSIELGFTDDIVWLGQLLSAEGLADEAQRRAADVVLLDLDMPGPDPFDALEEISQRSPEIKVLILTSRIQSDLIDHAVQGGAWGYISKNEGVRTILDAVRSAHRGEFILTPQVVSAAALSRDVTVRNAASALPK